MQPHVILVLVSRECEYACVSVLHHMQLSLRQLSGLECMAPRLDMPRVQLICNVPTCS